MCNLFPLDASGVHVIVRRGKVKAAFPDGSSAVSSMSREPSMRRLQMSVQVDASRSTTTEGKVCGLSAENKRGCSNTA